MMTGGDPRIEYRRFKSLDGIYAEEREFDARFPGRKPDREWTCFAHFIPDADVTDIKSRIDGRYVDFLPSVKPHGVWLTAGYHWLEMALKQLDAAKVADR